jgi:hypothetical protein
MTHYLTAGTPPVALPVGLDDYEDAQDILDILECATRSGAWASPPA